MSESDVVLSCLDNDNTDDRIYVRDSNGNAFALIPFQAPDIDNDVNPHDDFDAKLALANELVKRWNLFPRMLREMKAANIYRHHDIDAFTAIIAEAEGGKP